MGGRNTSTIEGPHATDWLYALECVDSFNKVRCNIYRHSRTNAAPTNAVPTNGVPTNAVPTNAVPTNAVPTNAVPTNAVPNNAVPTKVLFTHRCKRLGRKFCLLQRLVNISLHSTYS